MDNDHKRVEIICGVLFTICKSIFTPSRACCCCFRPSAHHRGLIVVRVIELLELSLELLHLHPHRPLRRRPLLRLHVVAQLVVHTCGCKWADRVNTGSHMMKSLDDVWFTGGRTRGEAILCSRTQRLLRHLLGVLRLLVEVRGADRLHRGFDLLPGLGEVVVDFIHALLDVLRGQRRGHA